jgi:hypothetical protein
MPIVTPPRLVESKPAPRTFPGWVIARALVLFFMLAWVGMSVAGVFDFRQYAIDHPVEFIPYAPLWTPQSFSQIIGRLGLSLEAWLQYRLVTSIIIALVFWSVGFLIYFRNGKNWFGQYIGAIFVLFGTASGDPSSAFGGMHPELMWLLMPLGTMAWWALFTLLYLFPNGRFTPRWTRWVALFLFLDYAIALIVSGGQTPPASLVMLIFVLLGIGVWSQVDRYRRVSTPLERQQTKWVIAALVVAFGALILSLLPLIIPDLINPNSALNPAAVVLSSLPSFVLALIPLSMAFAILRYHLWDIDLIIRRTLVYTALTALLASVFFGGVTLLQGVFTTFTGQQSPASVVISTLLIAALFNPLRRQVQAFIDRRFFRQKYDAAVALQEFSAAARREVALENLTAQLVSVVEKTIQPSQVTLWIRHPEKK